MRAETREVLIAREQSPLTRRERDVVRLIRRGLSNREIASELGMATATVKAHLGVIYVKLKVRGRTRLAVLEMEIG